jgi:hypothetical protein
MSFSLNFILGVVELLTRRCHHLMRHCLSCGLRHLHYGYHTSIGCNTPARYNKLVVGLGGVVVGGSSTTLEVMRVKSLQA